MSRWWGQGHWRWTKGWRGSWASPKLPKPAMKQWQTAAMSGTLLTQLVHPVLQDLQALAKGAQCAWEQALNLSLVGGQESFKDTELITGTARLGSWGTCGRGAPNGWTLWHPLCMKGIENRRWLTDWDWLNVILLHYAIWNFTIPDWKGLTIN